MGANGKGDGSPDEIEKHLFFGENAKRKFKTGAVKGGGYVNPATGLPMVKRDRKVFAAHVAHGKVFPKAKAGRPLEIGVSTRKKGRNELTKEMMIDLDISYADLASITGYSINTIRCNFAPSAVPPRWINVALFVYQMMKP